jgi:hypothetical protein
LKWNLNNYLLFRLFFLLKYVSSKKLVLNICDFVVFSLEIFVVVLPAIRYAFMHYHAFFFTLRQLVMEMRLLIGKVR